LNEKEKNDRYKPILDSLMSFIDGLENGDRYGREKVCTQEDLVYIIYSRQCHLMDENMSLGATDPALHANPKLSRSNNLQLYKKAFSFFIPNKLTTLNSSRMDVNPTKKL
jgi:hypothetical protein